MPKPYMNERVAVSDQLNDDTAWNYREVPDTKYDLDNHDVKRVAALMGNRLGYCNGERDIPTYLWLAESSLGIREVDIEPDVFMDPGTQHNQYNGFDLATAKKVVIGSATSKATINFKREPNSDDGIRRWSARFEDENNKSELYRNLHAHLGHASLYDLNEPQFFDQPYDEPPIAE